LTLSHGPNGECKRGHGLASSMVRGPLVLEAGGPDP
jgi:hypothetical protein